jgi:hypothetical protein
MKRIIVRSTALAAAQAQMVETAGFESWSKEKQDRYIKRHPNSKYAKNGSSAPSKPAKAPKATAPKAHGTKPKTKLTVQTVDTDAQMRKERLLNSQKGTKTPKAKVAKAPTAGKKETQITYDKKNRTVRIDEKPYRNPGKDALRRYREEQAKKKADALKPVKNKTKKADVVKVDSKQSKTDKKADKYDKDRRRAEDTWKPMPDFSKKKK